ncbi:MAG TPA: cytochrome c [Armatimonadota bacterium]|jgi:mono/diheme cytochrome c family protein
MSIGILSLSAAAMAALAGCAPPSTKGADGRPSGAKVYALYCAGCHGANGRRGPAPRRLDVAASQPYAALRKVIQEGRGAMPAWKGRLDSAEIDAVTRYLKTLGAPR